MILNSCIIMSAQYNYQYNLIVTTSNQDVRPEVTILQGGRILGIWILKTDRV